MTSKSSKSNCEKTVPSLPSQHFEGHPSQEENVNDLFSISIKVFIF